jgi:histidinol-phosphate aminotransferase
MSLLFPTLGKSIHRKYSPQCIKLIQIVSALKADPTIKIVFLTTPGNPTAALISPDSILGLLTQTCSFWNGVVVADEAYIDFALSNSSLCTAVTQFPNLIVLQTLSKSFGLAGIRLGIAFASPEITHYLNCMKAPYNISSPASALAMRALSPEGLAIWKHNVSDLLEQRQFLLESLQEGAKARRKGIPGVGGILGGLDANFLLVQIVDGNGKPNNEIAEKLYTTLAERMGVVVRFRGKERGCTGALRITVGTRDEMQTLLLRLQEWQNSLT